MTVVLGSSLAYADTLVSAKFDVDGDGVSDTVTVGLDGTVSVVIQGQSKKLGQLATSAWRIKAARVTGAHVGPRAVVLVRAAFLDDAGRGGTFADATEVAAFEWPARAPRRLFSETAGPMPQDSDLVTHIELGPSGVLRYQTRDGVTRCDEKTSRLEMRKFDFVSRRFRAVSAPPAIPTGTPVLMATRQAKPPKGLDNRMRARAFRFTAASTDVGPGRPAALDDGDAKTVWSEPRGGYGRGDFLTARARTSVASVVALRFLPGDTRSQKSFVSGNRLRRLLLVTDRPGSQHVIHILQDPATQSRSYLQPYWVVFKEPLPASCVSLVIDEVYFGSARKPPRQGDTAIAEIAILTELDRGGATSLKKLVTTIAGGGRDGGNAESLLGSFPRAVSVDALLAGLQEMHKMPAQQRQLALLLARIGDAKAAVAVAKALRETTRDDDFAHYSRGLRKMGTGAIKALGELLASTDASQRVRLEAAAVLGGIADRSAMTALLAVCGQGDRGLRSRVAKSLAEQHTTTLRWLAERLDDDHGPACTADLWRVIGLVAGRTQSGTGQTVIADRLAKQMAAEDNSYELHVRLLQAAARLPDQPAASRMLTAFMRQSDTEPALRRVVLDALPAKGAPLGMLTAATGDLDPGVRMRAITKLDALDRAGDDPAIIERLQKDVWPVVRRAAANALGNRCQRDAPASALASAALKESNVSVQRAALLGLVQCASRRLAKTLLAVIADPRQDRGLREKAATLLGKREHKALAKDVLTLFKAERQRAFRSGDAVRVAAALAKSLGALGDAGAQKSLLDAAHDPTFPFIQAGAIDALGRLCLPGMHALLRGFVGTEDRLVKRAATLSLRRCRR